MVKLPKKNPIIMTHLRVLFTQRQILDNNNNNNNNNIIIIIVILVFNLLPALNLVTEGIFPYS